MATEREIVPTDPTIDDRDDVVTEGSITPFEGDFMEVTIDVAEHLEKYGKAIDSILNFIIKRTYAGDWVSHDKGGTPVEDRTVNMIGAAAERIARDMGIQESNRTQPVKIVDEKHPGHYAYECTGDFTFRGRTIHAIGRASTLSPFYSRRGGSNINPDEIREEYILRDCWRDATKQAIKGLFGLRKIPLLKLQQLGYDISKVKYVNFQEGGKGAKPNEAATAAPKQLDTPKPAKETYEAIITIDKMEGDMSSKGNPFYRVVDIEGPTFYAWGDDKSERVSKLLIAFRDKQPIKVKIEKGTYPTIVAVL